jgi:hypothetical protein
MRENADTSIMEKETFLDESFGTYGTKYKGNRDRNCSWTGWNGRV